jgi:hypothetical protein
MTDTAGSAAETPGPLAHIRSWFERDIAPELAALRADVAKLREAAPSLATVATTLETVVKTIDPAASPEVAAASAALGEAVKVITRIAGELAPGM